MIRPGSLCAVILFVISISGCHKKIETRPELINYLKDTDNGLTREVVKTNALISASYIPFQLIERKQGQSAHSDRSSIKPSAMYFILRFSKDGKELLEQLDMEVYSDIFQTLSLRMIPLVTLRLDDGEPIPPSDCFLQQTYGLSGANELLLIFDSDKLANSKKYNLMIDEFGLDMGQLRYTFSRRDIEKLNRRLHM